MHIIIIHTFIPTGTFDVTSVQYSLYNTSYTSELCITCVFTNDTQAKGCVIHVVLFSTDTVLSLRIHRANNSDCIMLSDNGHYIMSVYDWEENGLVSNDAAVAITDIVVSGILMPKTMPEPVSSQTSQTNSIIMRYCLYCTVIFIPFLPYSSSLSETTITEPFSSSMTPVLTQPVTISNTNSTYL